jgi:hypothetical protein
MEFKVACFGDAVRSLQAARKSTTRVFTQVTSTGENRAVPTALEHALAALRHTTYNSEALHQIGRAVHVTDDGAVRPAAAVIGHPGVHGQCRQQVCSAS